MNPGNVGQIAATLLMAVGCGALVSDGEQQRGGLGGTPPDNPTSSGGQVTEPAADAQADGDLDAATALPPGNGLVLLDGGIESTLGCVMTFVLEPNPSLPCRYLLPQPDGAILGMADALVYVAGDATQYLVVRNETPTCNFGWRYIGDSIYAEIEFCSSTCDKITTDPAPQVDYVIKCIGPIVW